MKKQIMVKAGKRVVKVSARKAIPERELPIDETPKSYKDVSVEYIVEYIAAHEETAGVWYDTLEDDIKKNTNKVKQAFCKKFIPEVFAPQKKQYQTLDDKIAEKCSQRTKPLALASGF